MPREHSWCLEDFAGLCTNDPAEPLFLGPEDGSATTRTPSSSGGSGDEMGLADDLPGAPLEARGTHNLDRSSIARLREHFQEADGESSGGLTQQALFEHISGLVEADCGPLSADRVALLGEEVRRRFLEMALGQHGQIGEDEWVHFMMMRSSAPSYAAARLLSDLLRKLLRQHNPHMLQTLLSSFASYDELGDGRLRKEAWQHVFEKCGLPTSRQADLDGDGSMGYFEFVSCIMGQQPHEVELVMYDLSAGMASWIPSVLLDGHKFDGVWHTGVRAFGVEFWYGGCIHVQKPDDVPFGKPAKTLRLGKTLVTFRELLQFLTELTGWFNPQSYDVMRNNCNHFSNQVMQYLLYGKELPEEVMLQPLWAHNSTLFQLMRPGFNRQLGGFAESGMQEGTRIDELTKEWRSRVRVGDLALYRARFIDRPFVSRVVGLSSAAAGGERMAEIIFFRPTGARWHQAARPPGELWHWKVAEHTVPLGQMYPLEEGVSCSLQGGESSVMTPELAEELLHHEERLAYVAGVYFYNADTAGCGHLGLEEMGLLNERLSAELGVPPLSPEELCEAMDEVSEVSTRIGRKAFESFFRDTLCRVRPGPSPCVRGPFYRCRSSPRSRAAPGGDSPGKCCSSARRRGRPLFTLSDAFNTRRTKFSL